MSVYFVWWLVSWRAWISLVLGDEDLVPALILALPMHNIEPSSSQSVGAFQLAPYFFMCGELCMLDLRLVVLGLTHASEACCFVISSHPHVPAEC